MQNKITAIIPTYKRSRFLRRAILSVLNQTYPNVQVSVFDNASEDETQDVVRLIQEKDERVFYHCHATNIGVLQNFRYAFNSVKTPYFSILSDDDALAFDFYENAVKILDDNPDIGFVILDILTIDENRNLLGSPQCSEKLKFYRGKERLNSPHRSLTWTAMLFRKEVAEIYLEMDSRFDIGSDMRFLVHAMARYDFASFSKIGALFTLHASSISSNRKRFDIVHHAIQISRYIEIYHDENVNEVFKEYAVLRIKEMLTPTKKKSFLIFKETLKLSIKSICENQNLNSTSIHEEIKSAKSAGYNMSALLIYCFKKNKIIARLIKLVFSRYYLKYKLKQKNQMVALQNSVYKKIFDELQTIS